MRADRTCKTCVYGRHEGTAETAILYCQRYPIEARSALTEVCPADCCGEHMTEAEFDAMRANQCAPNRGA